MNEIDRIWSDAKKLDREWVQYVREFRKVAQSQKERVAK